ncbi:MAG: hypothetical protein KAY55_06100 [Deltaproteobacteria bacterium]|nr:hypothetical protein [Deltaproteobacteria bacterium]
MLHRTTGRKHPILRREVMRHPAAAGSELGPMPLYLDLPLPESNHQALVRHSTGNEKYAEKPSGSCVIVINIGGEDDAET